MIGIALQTKSGHKEKLHAVSLQRLSQYSCVDSIQSVDFCYKILWFPEHETLLTLTSCQTVVYNTCFQSTTINCQTNVYSRTYSTLPAVQIGSKLEPNLTWSFGSVSPVSKQLPSVNRIPCVNPMKYVHVTLTFPYCQC